jgi:hypothetical protein
MIYVIGILIATVGIAVTFTALSYLKMNISMARQYHKAAEGFFSSVKPLISDDETPIEILKTLDALNKMLTERRSARLLLMYLADERWRRGDFAKKNKIYVEFFQTRPELEESYKMAFENWFTAVTCLSPFFGKVVRLAMDEHNVERAVTTVSANAEVLGNNNHCSAHLTAA